MNPTQPLLSDPLADPSAEAATEPLGPFRCLSPSVSFNSSTLEERFSSITDDGEDIPPEEKPLKGSSRRLQAVAESRLFHHFLRECPPQEGKPLRAWGTIDLHSFPPSLEISMPATGQEKASKLERIYGKTTQFDDLSSLEDNPRLIYINDPDRTNDKYEFTGNEIRTSKYTVITFLPKNLFIQFHRVAYLYFLAIAALNQLPPLAVFGRTVSLFPLLFVLLVTAVKDSYEDWRRHRSDNFENNREVQVFHDGQFRTKTWKKILVGEVVKIRADESMPADMVLLGSSDPNGIAYIQTMNLDGESNLKTRYARQETVSMVLENGSYSGLIRCEKPNRNIYEFTANMEYDGQRVPLGQANIVLRGCQLKNTEWIVGVVVYAGQETKAMLNSAVSPSKMSRLEHYMNRETIWLSVFLLVMCAVVATGAGLWLKHHSHHLDTLPYYRNRYFTNGPDNGKLYKFYGIPMETFFSFLSSVIVFQIMIPISLYITMELVRLGQSYFMIEDLLMYDSGSDSRFQCRSLNINEDLGQIRYIFSDKTGTLTENKMEFRMASIYGKDYRDSSHGINRPLQEGVVGGRRWKTKSDNSVDPELLSFLQKEVVGEERIAAHYFFITLAACNTVIPMMTRCSSSGRDELEAIDYQGESPDEQALVAAAATYGYTLIERTSGHIVIDVNGEKLRLDVLGMHEFDSVRKRMSVVIRFPNNAVKVFAKGADSSMLNILDMADDEQRGVAATKIRHETKSHLAGYSSQGLRTLVIAARDLNNAEFEEWLTRYEEASTSLTERSAKLRQAANLIECNLNLLGATAIEDKLQEGVPEAIESLRQAGMKVWVLTGDKQETAISIGLSCRLLTQNMQRIVINGASEIECRKLLADAKARYGIKSGEGRKKTMYSTNSGLDFHDSAGNTRTSNSLIPETGTRNISYSEDASDMLEISGETASGLTNAPLALIIDGNSLVYILEKDLELELFDLATSCIVVLCCRVAPLQKAGIVDLIKCRTNDMTLAIGDGANDVSMIQMADVGVGICGQEGRQAVMASDFSMGQFRFLKRLLLVHGHWNYQRVGYLVLYNFYRNAVFVLMLFWYILFTAFSTTSALTEWSSVFYSVIYTSVPTILVGILDKDLSDKTLLLYPKLYGAGYRHESYSLQLFWIIMLDTLWQSLVLFYVPIFTYRNSSIDIWSMGSLWTVAVVVLVNIHLAMDIKHWVFITHIATWGSIIITYMCLVILDSIPVFPNYWTIYHLASSKTYWLTIFLIIVVAILPRYLFKVIWQIFWPSDIQIAREAEVRRKLQNHSLSKPDKSLG